MKSLRTYKFIKVVLIIIAPSMFMTSWTHGATSSALYANTPNSIEAIIHKGASSLPESQRASYYSGAITALSALQENIKYTIASLLSSQTNKAPKVPVQNKTSQNISTKAPTQTQPLQNTSTKTPVDTKATLVIVDNISSPCGVDQNPATTAGAVRKCDTTTKSWYTITQIAGTTPEPAGNSLEISKDRPISYYFPEANTTTARAYARLLSFISDPKYRITGPMNFGMYSHNISWNSMSGSCAEAETIARASCQDRNTGRAWSRNSINYRASWADYSARITTSKDAINYNLITADLAEVISCSNNTIKYRCSGFGYIVEPVIN